MKTHLFALLTTLAASLAHAAPVDDARALAERFKAAVASGQVDAVLDCYAEDARVIYPGRGEEVRGKPALRRLLESSLGTMKTQTIVQTDADTVPIDAEHLLNVGRWELRTTGPDGRPTTLVVRTTEILVKDGGTWRYFVDHASIGVPPAPAPHRRGARRR